MQVINKLSDIKSILNKKRTAIALGTFDGIHIGHQEIIKRAVSLAKEQDLLSVVFTFSEHPLSVLASEKMPLQIGDNISKARALEKLGVDILLTIPFTDKFSRQTPEEFLEGLTKATMPKFLVTGPNFSFGNKGKGTPRLLLRAGEEYGFQAEIVQGIQLDGKLVSSTRIRELIVSGDLPKVTEYLGRYFSFGGRVVHGDRRGRKLGFPTANLAIGDKRAMLPNGAYAVLVALEDQIYHGIANIGDNPTFEGCERRLEVNILDFNRDIYNKAITVSFVEKLREQKKFNGIEALIKQLHMDKQKAREIFARL